MTDYERGYEQGLEDGHRCEKRHATLASLEKQVAANIEDRRAAIAQAKRDVWEEAVELAVLADYGSSASPLDSFEVHMRNLIVSKLREQAAKVTT
mgnify:CR=1 FL=1